MKYTEASIKAAMLEARCQGQEGHRAKDYKARPYNEYYVYFECIKCKKWIPIACSVLDYDYGDIPPPRVTRPIR